jgi:hypothetical protein
MNMLDRVFAPDLKNAFVGMGNALHQAVIGWGGQGIAGADRFSALLSWLVVIRKL